MKTKIFVGKLLPAILSLAMLVCAIPPPISVFADNTETETSVADPVVDETNKTITITADVAAQLRATDSTWESKHSSSNVFVAAGEQTAEIEMTATTYFGAFYSFDALDTTQYLPEDAKITKITLGVYHYEDFNDRPFVVLKTGNPNDTSKIDDCFSVVSSAKSNETSTENSTRVGGSDGATEMVTETIGEKTYQIEQIDITKYFDENARNSYFLYNKLTTDNQKRKLSGKAVITITYSTPVASITKDGTTTKYYTFDEAYTAAASGDTIVLLDDVDLSAIADSSSHRYTFAKSITIKSDTDKKYTITSSGDSSATTAGILCNKDGSTITFEDVIISSTGGSVNNAVGTEKATVNMKNCEIIGNVVYNKANSKLNFDNTTVTGNVTHANGYSNNTLNTEVGTVSLLNGSKITGTLSMYKTDTVTADSTAKIDTLTIDTAAGEITEDGTVVITKSTDSSENLSPDQVGKVTNSGYGLYTDSSGNLAVKLESGVTFGAYATDSGYYYLSAEGDKKGVIRFLQEVTLSSDFSGSIEKIGFYIVDSNGDILKQIISENITAENLNGIYADLNNIPKDDPDTYYMKACVVLKNSNDNSIYVYGERFGGEVNWDQQVNYPDSAASTASYE